MNSSPSISGSQPSSVRDVEPHVFVLQTEVDKKTSETGRNCLFRGLQFIKKIFHYCIKNLTSLFCCSKPSKPFEKEAQRTQIAVSDIFQSHDAPAPAPAPVSVQPSQVSNDVKEEEASEELQRIEHLLEGLEESTNLSNPVKNPPSVDSQENNELGFVEINLNDNQEFIPPSVEEGGSQSDDTISADGEATLSDNDSQEVPLDSQEVGLSDSWIEIKSGERKNPISFLPLPTIAPEQESALGEATERARQELLEEKKQALKGDYKHAIEIGFPKNFKGDTVLDAPNKEIQASLVKDQGIMNLEKLIFTQDLSLEEMPHQFVIDLFRSHYRINEQEINNNCVSIKLQQNAELHQTYRMQAYIRLNQFREKLIRENDQGAQIFKNLAGLFNQFSESPGIEYVQTLFQNNDISMTKIGRIFPSYHIEDEGLSIRMRVKATITIIDGDTGKPSVKPFGNAGKLVGYIGYCREMVVSKEELSKDFLNSDDTLRFIEFTDYYSSFKATIEEAEQGLEKRILAGPPKGIIHHLRSLLRLELFP